MNYLYKYKYCISQKDYSIIFQNPPDSERSTQCALNVGKWSTDFDSQNWKIQNNKNDSPDVIISSIRPTNNAKYLAQLSSCTN